MQTEAVAREWRILILIAPFKAKGPSLWRAKHTHRVFKNASPLQLDLFEFVTDPSSDLGEPF